MGEKKAIRESVALGMGSRNRGEIRDEINNLVRVRTAMQTLKEDTNQVDVAIAKLQKHIREINKEDLNNIRRSFHTVTSGVNQFGEQLRRVSFIFRDIGRQMLGFGKQGMSMIQPNIKEFMDFEQAIVDVLAVTGDLTIGFDQVAVTSTTLGSFILDLAGKTRFSAQEIAGAAKTLALAGFSLEQVTSSLEALTSLAAATGSDLANTTNIIITTISSFQLSAEEAAKVTDIYTAAVTRSNTTITQLSEAMKVVAPSAAAMNQEISEVTAGLGILANAGIRGTSAGTGLSRVFTQLVEKSGQLDQMLKGLGSSFDRIDPEKVGLVDIIKEFERLNLSTAQLLDVFDLRAFRALQAILAQGSGSLERLNKNMQESSGLAQVLAEKRLKTLAGSVQLLSDGITALRIAIGELVAKEMKQLVDFARGIVETLKSVVAQNPEQVRALAKT
jgi:TP901 family phage tail tape measure protein